MRTRIPAWTAALGVACALFICGCAEKKPVLHIYNWTDYMLEDLIQQFEQENNCRVVVDNYDSNEAMYAKLKAGAGGYDLVFPSSYMVSIMNEQGMLQPINHDLIPNLKNIDRKFLKLTEDSDMDHSVPYMISVTGFGCLKDRVDPIEASWAIFDRSDLAGRMTLLNDMREVIGAALKYLGYSLNTTDDAQLAEARDVVIRWKKNIAKFESDQYKNGLASAEFFVCHGYNGDILQAQEENEEIEFVSPEEGMSLASDDMAILKDAPQPELAHKFINFIHGAEVSAANMEYVYYLSPNTEGQALLSDEMKSNPAVFIDPAILEKCEVIRDLGDENTKYTAIWDQIKAAE